MKDKLNRFIENTQGQFIEVSSKSALYQCMDLSYLWAFTLDIPKATIQHGSAYLIWENATDLTREYFDLIPNTPDAIPQDGDIVVWNNKYGKFGHVGIALSGGTTKSFMVFEQNNPVGSNAHVQSRTYTNISGWLRPKKVITEGTPQWLISFFTENNLTLNDESKVRSIFDKAKRYDDEVHGLKEQIKSVNESLADRAREVSLLTEKNQKLENTADELQEQLTKTRSERDSATWEKEKLQISLDRASDEIKALSDKVVRLEKNNDIYAYSFTERLVSLFRIK